MTTQMRDADMPLLDRIDAAIKRVTSGQGHLRVPVEATDPDMVLLDCKREIEQLRAAIEAVESAPPVGELYQHPETGKTVPLLRDDHELLWYVRSPPSWLLVGSLYLHPPGQQTARPLADWHEDDGAVVWWWFLVDEPAWIGTPLDDDWPGYHTHWTPHPKLPERER